MPIISEEKKEKISEQIIYYLYTIFPKQVFTAEVAKEIARDEEFTKKILINMGKRGLVIRVDKNPKGVKYELRLRWRISNKAHAAYKEMQ